nr:hypothetical protein [Mucilaginibacter sp. X4EP1]
MKWMKKKNLLRGLYIKGSNVAIKEKLKGFYFRIKDKLLK